MVKSKVSLVYKVTSPSGKLYFGMTCTSLLKRKKAHIYTAFKGSSFHFHNAIRKYTEDMLWEVVAEFNNQEEASKEERRLIALHKSYKRGIGYNMTKGGEFNTFTQEVRDKIGAGNKGKTISEETRFKISNTMLGHKKSKETKIKMSISLAKRQKGKKLSPQAYEALKEYWKTAPPRPQELRDRISLSLGAKPFIVFNKNTKEVVYKGHNQNQACRQLALRTCALNKCLKGKIKSTKGYIAKYE